MNGFGIIFPDWEIPKENPLRTLKEPILFTDWELQKVSCVSSSLSTSFCTLMNLPNVARYGREMSNVHQCHPRAVKRF